MLENAIDTFHNLHKEYLDLITKFLPCSSKLNTPFSTNFIDFRAVIAQLEDESKITKDGSDESYELR